jgi:hypothetical protein
MGVVISNCYTCFEQCHNIIVNDDVNHEYVL